MQPDETGVTLASGQWHQHVDDIRPGSAYAMTAGGRRAGEDGAPAAVEQGSHLPLIIGRGTGMGQVDARHEQLPGPGLAAPVSDGRWAHPAGQRLLPADRPVLPGQHRRQCCHIKLVRPGHAHTLAPATDNPQCPTSWLREP